MPGMIPEAPSGNGPSSMSIGSVALINLFRELFWICEIGFVTRLVSILLNNVNLSFFEISKLDLQQSLRAPLNSSSSSNSSSPIYRNDMYEYGPDLNGLDSNGLPLRNPSFSDKNLNLGTLRREIIILLAEHSAWIPLNFPNFAGQRAPFLAGKLCSRPLNTNHICIIIRHASER